MDDIKRGELYYADLSPVVGSEQGGVRPVLIVQNDIGNRYSPTVIVAAITSQINKAKIPTHIELGTDYGLVKDSVLLLEQIRTQMTDLQDELTKETQAEEERRVFINNVSHELKTPIAVISSQIEMIKMIDDEDKRKEYIDSITEETEKIQKAFSDHNAT